MALDPSALQSQLETGWLVPPGGSYPDTATVSAQRFASAVASWFSLAQANGFPCTTAAVRQSELASLAAIAFAAGSPGSTGKHLAIALALYITGQQFGAGVAAPPTGTGLAAADFDALFADLQSPNALRAQKLASICQTLALTTIVTFPPPLPPSPVL